MVSGLPPLFQTDWRTLLRFASAAGAFRRVRLGPGEHRGGHARDRGGARILGLVGADQDRLHVALELQALEHLLIRHLVVAAGMLDRLLGAGNLRHLARDLADVAEPHGRRRGIGRGVVAFELGVGGVCRRERLGLPFMIHRRGLGLVDGGHERGIGRIDAIDHVAEILAIADRRVGREGIGGKCHLVWSFCQRRLAARRAARAAAASRRLPELVRRWSRALTRSSASALRGAAGPGRWTLGTGRAAAFFAAA